MANIPQIKVDAAFGSYPRAASYSWTNIHDSNSPAAGYVRSVRWQRGVDDLVNRMDTGSGSLVLRNSNRAWDPAYTGSPFYPNIIPYLPVRVQAVIGATTYDLMQHYMTGFQRVHVAPAVAEVQVPTVDGLAGMALATPSPNNASLTIDPSGSNNTLLYTARNPGMAEEDISIRYYGAPHPLQVQVSHTDIAVRLHIPGLGGNPGNSANQVIAAIQANASANALVTVANSGGSDGTGIISDDVAATHLAGADAAAFPQELSGARIGRCLDQAGWPAALRTLDPGTVQVVAQSFSSNEQGRLLSHMMDVAGEAAEFGMAYVAGNGKLVFLDRASLFTTGTQNTVAATFSDQPTAGQFPYTMVVPNDDGDHMINEWTGSREGGVTITVRNQTSINQSLGRRTRNVASLLTTDTQVEAQLQYGCDEYGSPVQRLASMTVMPATSTAMWQACLALDLGARIRVIEHPPGGGSAIDSQYMIIGLQGSINPGPTVTGTFQYSLWPIRINNYFVFDDATFGNLNTTVLAYN